MGEGMTHITLVSLPVYKTTRLRGGQEHAVGIVVYIYRGRKYAKCT